VDARELASDSAAIRRHEYPSRISYQVGLLQPVEIVEFVLLSHYLPPDLARKLQIFCCFATNHFVTRIHSLTRINSEAKEDVG